MKSILINKNYILFIFLMFLITCKNQRVDMGHFDNTFLICNGIFLEEYMTYGGGALGGDMMCQYLTDSINFRVRIGEFDNGYEHYSYNCNGDSITVVKTETQDDKTSSQIQISKTYNLKKLKLLKNISKPIIENISDESLW